MSKPGRYNLCCNPLRLKKHRVKNSLRRASVTQRYTYNLSKDDFLCTLCRKALSSTKAASAANDNEDEVEDIVTEKTISQNTRHSHVRLIKHFCEFFNFI